MRLTPFYSLETRLKREFSPPEESERKIIMR
jgi:hypothetical protein